MTIIKKLKKDGITLQPRDKAEELYLINKGFKVVGEEEITPNAFGTTAPNVVMKDGELEEVSKEAGDDFEAMTKAELHDALAAENIEYDSKATKAELIELLKGR